jgi:hypothetical protein
VSRNPHKSGKEPVTVHLCGLCVACHHLIHTGHLTCHRDPDGTLLFTTNDGRIITNRRQHTLNQLQHRIA